MSPKPITIVGGGLAGLTLGIALRQRDIPVTVWEAGRYPRHRVCGEFISGRGQAVLESFGLREELLKAGAILAHETVFFIRNAASSPRPVKPAALCLSRYKLDALLARRFQICGGNLRENARRADVGGEGTVRASGRRVQLLVDGWRWFGLKVHATNVELSADLEMHCLPNQYVGVSRIENGMVNICGLLRRRGSSAESPRTRRDLLRGPPGSPLHRCLERAVFDDAAFCSVAGLRLQPERGAGRDECCIGDALTMIPPVSGNGMSMAFEAAALAVTPLAAYSRGETDWPQARGEIARSCDDLFSRRLRWADLLQRVLFLRCAQSKLACTLLNSDALWNVLFAKTR
jgi:2-polyprenyl-6-methoxyphenol hydroxylase-like FAD-dependent oxidoreductase